MLFRRRSRSYDAPVVQIVGDCSVQVSPTTATKSNKPNALGDSFVLSASHLLGSHNRGGSSDEGYQSNSSPDASPPQRKAPTPKRFPTSRKTGFATIHTDSTDTQPAFESDAFAVLMPTTRLPILDHPISRAKMASPAARAEALRTYQEKAHRNRERNDSQGVKVPQMRSYDYAARQSPDIEARTPTPAGSFPISPPLPQHSWARTGRATEVKVGASRHVNNLSTTTPVSKPLKINTSTTTTTPTTSRYRVYRTDSTAGASRSPCAASALPPTITVRIKSKPKVAAKDAQHVHTKSTHNIYNLPYDVSPPSSRSPSPVKTMPNFTRHNSVEGDSIFGYNSKDTDGAVAGASPTTSGSEKENEEVKTKDQAKPKAAEKSGAKADKTTTPKRTLTSRWPWLRPSSPRIPKPTTTPVVFSTPPPPPRQPPPPPPTTAAVPKPTPRPMSGYVDPFERHATPPAPTPAPAPKKVITKPTPKSAPKSTPAPKPTAPSTPKFDTGFAQIQSLGLILLKFCFALYALVALWFVLDAMREAIHTVGIPFRAVKWVGGWGWAGVCWVGRVIGAVGGKR